MTKEDYLQIASTWIALEDEIEEMIVNATTDEQQRENMRNNIRYVIRTAHWYEELQRF